MKREKTKTQGSLMDSGRNPIALAVILSIPAVAEQLLLTATGYVDTAMVGTLGAEGSAAISVTAAVVWLMNGLMTAVSTGYSVLIATAIGAGNPERVRRVQIQALLGGLSASILLAAVIGGISPRLPVWLGAEAEIQHQAYLYIFIIAVGLPGRALSTTYSAILRCMGDTRTPMTVNAGVNLLNVVLNWLLIFESRTITLAGHSVSVWGAGLGVSGAALGTILSMALGGIIMAVRTLFFSGEYCPRWRGNVRFDAEIQKSTIVIAIPIMLERVTINGGQILMTRVISTLGTIALAANYVAVMAEQICYSPAFGFSSACTALVGQAIGAREWKKSLRFGKIITVLSLGFATLIAVLFFALADFLSGLFTSDPQVAVMAADMIRICAFSEPLAAVSTVIAGGLRAAGEARYPFYVGIICMMGIRVIMTTTLIFGFHFGLGAYFAAIVADQSMRGILNYARFRRGSWVPEEERAGICPGY